MAPPSDRHNNLNIWVRSYHQTGNATLKLKPHQSSKNDLPQNETYTNKHQSITGNKKESTKKLHRTNPGIRMRSMDNQ